MVRLGWKHEPCPRLSSVALGVGALLLCVACGDEVVENQPTAAAAKGASKPKSRRGKPTQETSSKDDAPPKVEFQEEDFVETERSRDPFRAYFDLFDEQPDDPTAPRPPVILEEYALDDLRLIGIITRIRPAKAMLVDPSGKGHVIEQTNLVGKAERVQAGAGTAEYEINWKVDRIRDSDVVFVREDPSNPDVPSATKVIPLHPEADEEK